MAKNWAEIKPEDVIHAVFIYEREGEVCVLGVNEAAFFQLDADWELIATVQPRAFISTLLNENPRLIEEIKSPDQ